MAGDLVTLMQGKDSLNHWDMLVAYDETILNTLLTERASGIPRILTDFITGKTILDYTVEMQFKTPTMSFDTTDFDSVQGYIIVNFPVIGKIVQGDASVDLPTDMTLSCCTPLICVSGSTNTVTPHGTIVVFDPNSPNSTETVTLDFKNPSVIRLTVPPGSTTDLAKYNNGIVPTIADYLRSAIGFEYRLAGLSNAIPDKRPYGPGSASNFVVDQNGLSFTFVDSQRIKIWKYDQGAHPGEKWKHSGNADVTCTVTDSATWHSNDATNELSLPISDAQPSVNLVCNPQEHSLAEKIFGNGGPSTPDAWKSLTTSGFSLELYFGGLNYFLATNLLFPGSHVFKPDPLATGFRIPRDTLITGTLQQKPA
ncbi:hypothetical protein QFC22_004954 [Naganishia vaughanmartiniae]|uniref:Uncharacterized protein n=1 Tax=Naganishia vaughanmartiniae TaxID=1424756 RepID=A0ACC2WWC3_9TREE|nr:hypothetical protein QFC22_004954 [Naganishia vaughanmartiniae]